MPSKRSLARQDLLHHPQQLLLIVEAMPAPIAICRASDGVFLFINDRFNNLFGFSTANPTPPKIYEICGNKAGFEKVIAQTIESGPLQNYEMQTHHCDGSLLWISLSTTQLFFQGEQVLLIVFQNVTAHKEMEITLQRSTHRLTILHEIEQELLKAQSAEQIATYSLQKIMQLIPCQRASLALFDFESREAVLFVVSTTSEKNVDVGARFPLDSFANIALLAQGNHMIMPDMTAVSDLTPLEYQRLQEGIKSYVNIPLLIRGQLLGSLNLAATQPNPWTQEHMDIARELANQMAIAVDQTQLFETIERRAAELEALRQIELELTAQLDLKLLLDSILSWATRLVDAEASVIYLHQPEEDVMELVADQNEKGVPTGTQFKKGEGITGKVWETNQTILVGNYATWDGRISSVDSLEAAGLGVPIRWGNDVMGVLNILGKRPYCFSTAHTHLIELLAAQAAIAIHNAQQHVQIQESVRELEARNSELERFTYTVSHDLKSPLVTIRGFLGFLEKDMVAGNAGRITSDIARIREATDKMQILLEDLLELSRVGRLINPPQWVTFRELVEEALQLTAGRMADRRVRVDIAHGLPAVFVDRSRLVEMLQNLLDNAAKFMGDQPAPKVEIGAERRNQETLFFVRDNGIGIHPNYHHRVFGLFERLNPTIEGTGIGLALVKRIVEVHNGRIWIDSDGSGNGTTFCFTLPTKEGN